MFSNELTIGWLYNFFHILVMGMVWLRVLLVQGLIHIPQIPSTLPFSCAYCKVPDLGHRLKRPVPLFCLALELMVHGFDNASDLSDLKLGLTIKIPKEWYDLGAGETKWQPEQGTKQETDCEDDHESDCKIEHKEYGGIEHEKDQEMEWENQQEMEWENQQEMGSGQQDSKNKEWTVVEVNLKQSRK
ncbi:hypothetical protein BS47DRAFT_1363381 [Hydnum rufescens UP504]|uniref:Uncharacterized protein n=1 Tax=Hydnum rufescens UP504 TaxID=1448309 RepID=A0A9P6AUS9_9AGAM|nr:hypothetical protein BS47DRAFT_1363381 [Hydnum rufescens UP504]